MDGKIPWPIDVFTTAAIRDASSAIMPLSRSVGRGSSLQLFDGNDFTNFMTSLEFTRVMLCSNLDGDSSRMSSIPVFF